MKFMAKILVAVSMLSWIVPATPIFADDVTLTGILSFGALDGSAQDHDGAVNGVFTVNDGDLVIAGTIRCNDDPPLSGNAGACPIAIDVSGELIVEAGGGIFAENLRGGGKGGDISLQTGGDLILQGTSGSLAGAVVSSGQATGAGPRAGDITFSAQGEIKIEAGSVISAGAHGGTAGTIEISAGGLVTVAGLVASGPSRTVLATALTGRVLDGGTGQQIGGPILIRSTASDESGIRIEAGGIVVSQGENPGAQLVQLEACGIEVLGLVASIAKKDGPAQVVLRSGRDLRIDGRDLGSATGPRRGRVRADAIQGGASTNLVDLFAQGDIEVLGPDPAASTLFAISSSPGSQAQSSGGTITSISLDGTLTATGNAFEAGRSSSGNQGGSIDLQAKGDVALDGAMLKAVGGFTSNAPTRKGGRISARSFAGALSWTFGVGDVRPVGSGAPASRQGTITLTACASIDTTGTQFPTVGSALLPFPVENEGICSPTAPSLPGGEPPLPNCTFNEAPVADNDAYTVGEGGTLNVAAPGVLDGDTDADGDSLTAVLVSGPAHDSSFTLNPDGSFSYEHDGSETTSDFFTYKANDGTTDSNVATVTITINPVNDIPLADDDAYNVNEGGTLNVAAPGVLDGDTDGDGDSLTAVLVSGPVHASSFTLNSDGSFSYTHDGSGATSDSFTYKANDGTADSNVATVNITIAPVNDVPLADNDAYSVNEGGTLNVAAPGVLDGDTDGDGDPLTAVLVSGPAHALPLSFVLNANGSFSYTHDGSETLTDSFTYTANDGTANSLPATVTITIAPVNDAPSAQDDSATTDENTPINILVLANDSDPEGGSLTIVSTGGTPAGAVINNGNNISYNPTAAFNSLPQGAIATDTFTYTIQDGGGLQSTATVTVTIGGLNDNPTADDETYSAIGNTRLAVQKTGPFDEPTFVSTLAHVLDGDTDPDTGDSVSAVAFSGTLPSGAVLDLASDGTFFYTPPAGRTTPDTFTYTIQDESGGTDTGTVTINFAKMVWYVDNTSGTPNTGSGTSTEPFSTLSDGVGNSALDDAEDASAAGHIIYVFKGDGTDNLLDQGITLKNQQKLWGQGVDLVVDPDDGGPQPPVILFDSAPADKPLVANGSGNAVAVLANTANGSRTGIEIRGLSLSSTAAGFNAIDVTSADAANVEVRISENLVTGAPAEGIDINAGSTGSATIAVHDNTLTTTGTSIDITRTSGTVVITAFDDNVISGDTNGAGIVVTGPVILDATPGGTLDLVSGGITVIGDPGNSITGAGLMLGNVTGALAFTDLDIFAGGAGVTIAGTGAFTGAAGTRVTVPNGVSIVQAGNGPGVDVSNATIDMRLATLTVSASPTTGVSMVNVSDATIAPTAAFFSAGSGSTITNVTGTDFNVDGGNATISYAGSINNSAGRSVSVQNRTADSVTFANTSTINDTGAGILVNANASGAGTDFLGILTLSTGTNAAFTATSGGTLRVMGATNSIATTTGVALNVTSTTIGTGGSAPETGLRFRSISAGTAGSGPANGIVLNSTGVLGSLTVTGNGSTSLGGNDSGGIIQSTTSDAISLTNTRDVSLTNMRIQNVTGGVGSRGIEAVNLAGSNYFRYGTITGLGSGGGADRNGIDIRNTDTNMALYSVENSVFSNSDSGTSFIFSSARGTSNMRLDVLNSDFSDLVALAIQSNGGDTEDTAHTVTTNIIGNTFRNASPADGQGGVAVAVAEQAATHNFTISNNTFYDLIKGIAGGNSEILLAQTTGGTLNGTISGNTIGNATAGNGDRRGIGVIAEPDVSANGELGSVDVIIENNTIDRLPNREAIFVDLREDTQNSELIIRNNFIGLLAGFEGLVGGDLTKVGAQREAIDVQTRGEVTRTLNLLFSGNNVRANTSVNVVNLEVNIDNATPGNLTMHATVSGNSFKNDDAAGLAELIVRPRDAGAVTTLCLDMTGNTLDGGSGQIDLNETGVLNVEQASQAGLAAGNGIPAGNVLITGGAPSFGIVCLAPPS